ncbi:DUF6565 domain-containing protein [Pontibacter mangrovi]|uniref:DUF4890 domain-containing protein n=1 Tax=Pontibacter mangrovi TaxID=2589816 RepID=A0A501W1N3_9BACT|nr:DUF6565 domain-containing protein [Pontibacter mangrovi]TPE43883.1 hypothetical protein FJM65_10660 [Pontibacter mangrovi]
MKRTNRTYAKVMLVAALGFSFAAGATDYNNTKAKAAISTIQNDQELSPLQKQLLGEHANIGAITADSMRQAYITFMDNVREQKGNWTDAEWQQAKELLEKLDAHKETVEKELGTDDKAKIKMLQAEFRTLETAGDVKD